MSQVASAASCVNPHGTSGCFSSISAAVAAASPHQVILVGPGKYKEDVVIGIPLTLIGTGRDVTFIDATGLSNGVYVDGPDHPGLSNVLVAGFTIENANFECILVTNASRVTISKNRVVNDDVDLNIDSDTCSRQPAFETSEGDDCGEGIHFIAVDHSVISNNISEDNAGGILITDETGTTPPNLISGNIVRNNPYDCGITLASHPSFTSTGAPYGIFENTIINNESTHNGTEIPGAGAGVGIFTFLPGGRVSENLVLRNVLKNNGLPGIAFHAHSPGEDLNNNVVAGNIISGNGADTEDSATPGTAGINIFGVSPITGTVLLSNIITDEADDIVTNTPAEINAHLNQLLGGGIGVNNLGTGTVDARENWWGCWAGPSGTGCTTIAGDGVQFKPWLFAPIL